MRPTRLAAFAAAALLVTLTPAAGAQSLDGMRWSLFAGQTISTAAGADRSFGFPAENFGVGVGLDFRLRYVPVDLRATAAYDKFRGGPSTTYKVTSVHLDGIFRPVPAVLGVRPYLIGGFGIATQAPSGLQDVSGGTPVFVPIARHSALGVDAGVGVEFRRFFMEYRRSPFQVVGDGLPTYTPVSLGLRF